MTKHSGIKQILFSFTVAGAVPALLWIQSKRTGFPFNSLGGCRQNTSSSNSYNPRFYYKEGENDTELEHLIF